ncbi:hypothetical protein [Clostridium sp. D33t1_170424_F3]|uniref:hypothetical protein n=1 Tax=Clostridium sp. D33t1_170424_F3 TaxID=2787099 RepID=UPI0018AA969E|nr:hypothetical protein [Clostridium sp. D33t1_170424_F3]
MTEKGIRNLSKTELLTIIRDQEAELVQAQAQIADLQSQLSARTIAIEECGSLAEAALRLNNVFQTAQAAADQYLFNVQEREDAFKERMEKQEADAALQMELRLKDLEARCRTLEEESQKKANAYWEELQIRLEDFYQSHEGLEAMLAATDIQIVIPKPDLTSLQQETNQETEKGIEYDEAEDGTAHVGAVGQGTAAQEP